MQFPKGSGRLCSFVQRKNSDDCSTVAAAHLSAGLKRDRVGFICRSWVRFGFRGTWSVCLLLRVEWGRSGTPPSMGRDALLLHCTLGWAVGEKVPFQWTFAVKESLQPWLKRIH
eukprot:jgi/Bigna1/59225/fgenesh1_kg.3_\